ncbi:MAG: secretin N-terminal domain-containing protein [Acidobacteriota bacterium]
MKKTLRVRILCAAVAALALSSCATYRNTQRAGEAVRAENWDAAVYYYLEALASDPANVRVKMALQRARIKAADIHFRLGMRFKQVGELQRARTELELAVQLDPTHQYAEVELSKVRKDLEIAAQEGGAAKLEEMKRRASEMRVRPPALNPASPEPITLSFPNPTNVREIYRAIGQAFGINVLFEPKLKDNKISIELRDVTARKALETVMQAAGHFYKVLDEKSIMVIEDTPQNRRDYEDLVVKTFFLSNADVKDVNNMLRALIEARRIAVNEQLNSIVIRDTADKVAIAERLINANDKSKAELLVDVELIQVDSSKLQDIGVSLTNYRYTVGFDASAITGSSSSTAIPLERLGDITRSMWSMVVPNVAVNLFKSAGEAETLAQPQLRMTEGEKGNLVIGDRVPIPTTTFNTSNTIGGNIVPITAFNYQDVGIKIEIEPRVHHNNEITLKLKVEVSELGEDVEVAANQKQPKIGTRTIDSVIRLKDGETSLLAGLFKYAKRTSRGGLPWLQDIPVLGALFRSNVDDMKKTDLILTLTPHIIRNPNITEEDLAPVWVGTENKVSVAGNSPRVHSPAAGTPFGESPAGGEAVKQEEEAPPAPEPGRDLLAPKATEERSPQKAESPGINPMDVEPIGVAPPATTSEGLAKVSFYPARVPAVVGSEADVTVVLDPGIAGAGAPVHLAYDPARLEVTEVVAGDLPTRTGSARVQVTHTAPVGWIQASWAGEAIGSGTLLNLRVRPRVAGEIPLVFAGPVGAVVGGQATVVALPATTISVEVP